MADPTTVPVTTPGNESVEMFTADREKFWESFTSFSTYAVIAVVALLVAMAVFLV